VSTFCDSLFYAFKTGGGPIHELDVLQRTALGIQTISSHDVSVYPNPANTEMLISAGGQKVDQAVIYDLNGQNVKTTDKPANNKIDVSSLTEGVYIMQVNINGQISRVKFAKVD
jgi:hypothetical protein